MSFVIDRLSDSGIEFFSMIHDSFGVMANSVPLMREVTKETFLRFTLLTDSQNSKRVLKTSWEPNSPKDTQPTSTSGEEARHRSSPRC